MEGREKDVLVTGAAGFIGFHLSKRLLEMGYRVTGVDNLNPYYDVNLKRARLKILKAREGFSFYHQDIQDLAGLKRIFGERSIGRVCNLAAQAGVRYSLKDPFSYQRSNVEGFLNLLELAREHGVDNFVYASSSSVYGKNRKIPYSVDDRVDNPISLYAATKKANELMAHAYSHLFSIPCTGLRYFTVYGPWGRPDMAPFKFMRWVLEGKEITRYGDGSSSRDYTYVGDIVAGIISALNSGLGFEIINLGNNEPVKLNDFIATIEKVTGKKAKITEKPLQAGDVPITYADISKARRLLST